MGTGTTTDGLPNGRCRNTAPIFNKDSTPNKSPAETPQTCMSFALLINVEKLRRICILHVFGILTVISAPAPVTAGVIRRCSKAHLTVSTPESFRQIQKDLQGNRPLIAIIRGAKKNPELEAALTELIQSLPAQTRDSFLENTGYEIEKGKLVLRKEVKTVPRDWNLGVTKQTLEALKAQESMEAAKNQSGKPAVHLSISSISSTKHLEYINFFIRHAFQNILHKNGSPWYGHNRFYKEFVTLLTTHESSFYFLLETKILLDGKNMKVYQAEGAMTPDQAAFIYNQAIHSPGAYTGVDAIQGRQKFIEKVEAFAKYADENLNQLLAEQVRALEEKRKQQLDQEAKKSLEQKTTSMRELIENIEGREAEVISKPLIELIESVDSSSRQQLQILAAKQSEKPQLKLLEIAYHLKKHDELTQKEIQSAVFAGLEEVTKPEVIPVPSEPSTPDNRPVDRNPETQILQIPVESISAKGSGHRVEKLKHRLFEEELSSTEDISVSVHNKKEFFEVFKPGTPGFIRLETDAESMRQQFARVLGYFTGNGSREIVSGDGHFAIEDHRIFSMRWGEYRLLVTAEKSESGSDILAILRTYPKSKEGKHNYRLAITRMIQRGHSP